MHQSRTVESTVRQRVVACREDVDQTEARPRPTARLIHLPVHASWLNQIEPNFLIVQRKALSPGHGHCVDHRRPSGCSGSVSMPPRPGLRVDLQPAKTSTTDGSISEPAAGTIRSLPNSQNLRRASSHDTRPGRTMLTTERATTDGDASPVSASE